MVTDIIIIIWDVLKDELKKCHLLAIFVIGRYSYWYLLCKLKTESFAAIWAWLRRQVKILSNLATARLISAILQQ